MEQKCDIATRELDELREELQRKKDEMERSHDNHKVLVFSAHTNVIITWSLHMQAVVAEADLRIAEMKKAAYEFDRDIVRGAVNPVS